MSAATASYYMPSNTNSHYSSTTYNMAPTLPQMSPAELDAAALETFVYNPVTEPMIEYLAMRTNEVIACDSPVSSGSSSGSKKRPSGEPADVDEGPIPTLKEFITRLVVCSNVQVPTLMSSLVYLTRLKARLQPHATGRRSTPHRIFLATLILAAKYLNDSSPKNKHWARYTYVPVVSSPGGAGIVADFSFRTAEVNEMERQLLSLLSWDLRIEEDDLVREFEPFLAPIRRDVADRFARRQRRKYEQAKAAAAAAAAQAASSTASSVYSASSRSSRSDSSASAMSHGSATSAGSSVRSRSTSPYPPSLTYSSGHSPSSSQGGSSPPGSSRATTPEEQQEAYVYCGPEELAIAAAAAGSPDYRPATTEKNRPHIFGRLAAAFQSR